MPKCFIRSDRPSEKLALAGTHKILVVPELAGNTGRRNIQKP
jgi:hypothetical protein